MSRGLILGGDGFIGGYFIRNQKIHKEIIVISRRKSSNDYIEYIYNNPFEIGQEAFNDFDIVYNYFGLAHKSDTKNKEQFYKINYELAVNLAAKAKAAGVKKFVHMSSVSVYGYIDEISINTLEEPETHYGRSKLMADKALLKLADEKFSVLLLRPPMIYGPGAPGNMKKLISLVNYLPLLPFKNAHENRAFLCIDNFMFLLKKAIADDLDGIQLLCDVRTFSTKELVELIIQTSGKRKVLINLPLKKIMEYYFPTYYRKLFRALNIHPSISWSGISNFKDPSNALMEMVKDTL